MNESINIKGLDKAEVLAALYNASKQQGMGFMDSRGASLMSKEQAQEVIERVGLNFDYLQGRVMKVHLGGDSLEPWGYDRDNGRGAAARSLAPLLETQPGK